MLEKPQTLNYRNTDQQQQRNPDIILIVGETLKFTYSIQIEEKYAKHFRLKGFLHAFNTARENVHLASASKEEADMTAGNPNT